MDKTIETMADELSNYFIETVASWTKESEEKAYKFKSLHLSDMSHSLFDELSDSDRKAVVDLAEELVGDYND